MAKGAGLPIPFFASPSARAASQLDEARDVYRLHPDDRPAAHQLARAYLGADSAAMAERTLLASLGSGPQYAPSLALLSKLRFDTGRHAQAIDELAFVRTHPDSFASEERRVLLTGLALHLEALGEAAEARAVMAEAGRGKDAAGSAAVYFALLGDHADAADAPAAAALRESPKSAVDLNNFGITRLRAGEVEEARRSFLSAIERDPRLAGPYYNLAILEKFYRFDEAAAARWLTAYRERSSADPDSLFGAIAPGSAGAVVDKGRPQP